MQDHLRWWYLKPSILLHLIYLEWNLRTAIVLHPPPDGVRYIFTYLQKLFSIIASNVSNTSEVILLVTQKHDSWLVWGFVLLHCALTYGSYWSFKGSSDGTSAHGHRAAVATLFYSFNGSLGNYCRGKSWPYETSEDRPNLSLRIPRTFNESLPSFWPLLSLINTLGPVAFVSGALLYC